MRMTAKNNNKGTWTFDHVLENLTPIPPGNATLTLTMPQRPGGEMYGM
jgi:hypothetical protein